MKPSEELFAVEPVGVLEGVQSIRRQALQIRVAVSCTGAEVSKDGDIDNGNGTFDSHRVGLGGYL